MFLTDFHIHSSASADAADSMLDMGLASAERGIRHLCFTDHVDLDYYETGEFNPDYFSMWPEMQRQYQELLLHKPAALETGLGIELSACNHYPRLARETARTPELDFVIASVHNLYNTKDFFCIDYQSREQCQALTVKYLEENIETAGLDCFDVLGHIGYTKRYMLRAGFDVGVELPLHREPLTRLFEILIRKGKGIELNISGLRNRKIAEPFPALPILKLYRQLGGEIVTVGTDAHRVSDAGRCVERGYELLIQAGFKYVTIYKKRKPQFVSIV